MAEPNTEVTAHNVDLEKRPAQDDRSLTPDDQVNGQADAETPQETTFLERSLNLGMLLTALDFNIVATAVPIISSEFQDHRNSSWLGTGSLVTFVLVLPIYAKLGDMFGRRRMFILGNLIFILGSGRCGGSKSINMLIWFRAVQGIGAGGIYDLLTYAYPIPDSFSFAIITDLVPLQEVGRYLSFTALIWALADIARPLLGGAFSHLLITVFFLKLPAPKVSIKQKFLKYEYLGTVPLVGGTVSVLLAISWVGKDFPWNSAKVIGCLVRDLVTIIIFPITQFWTKDPILSPTLMKNRTVLTIFGAEFSYGATLLGMTYYIPQFFQLIFGDSAMLSSVGLLPVMLGLAIGNPLAAWITSKYGIKLWNAIVGSALEVLASGLMVRWNANTSHAEAVVLLIIVGVGQGAVMSGLLLTAQVAFQPQFIGIVTGLIIFIQTVSDIFGIAFYAAVYVNKIRSALPKLPLIASQISSILADVKIIKHNITLNLKQELIPAYAKSLQNGRWLMFACAVAMMIFSALSKQPKFLISRYFSSFLI